MVKITGKTVGCMRCAKPNSHKWDVVITIGYTDVFGKHWCENKLWDTCTKSDLDESIAQAKKHIS